MSESFAGRSVCVAGIAVSGAAAARVLAARDARVTVVDERDGPREQEAATALERQGAQVRLGQGATAALPDGTDLVVTSPGWRPEAPLLRAALDRRTEVIGEPELAWRLQDEPFRVPWLGVTGTNGKTTTVGMLASILQAAGYRTVAAGNVGAPLVDAVLADPPYDVIVAEMSSFQLHWASRLEFDSATVLNVAPDHLDWHGSFDAYATAKGKIFTGTREQLFNADDPVTVSLLPPPGDLRCAHSFSATQPADFCVEGGVLLDRVSGVAAAADRALGGSELARVDDVTLPGSHNVANALAAAGLARLLALRSDFDVPPAAVRAGLRAFRPGGHRNELVATTGGVAYVDDSKATNPHAADASLTAYDHVVWLAGGLLKGADVDGLVATHARRLRGAVLFGRDREQIRVALARHAPDVPVVEVPSTDTGAMRAAVREAAGLARPGDTVLLAPAAASMDMFRDYQQRGEQFAAAVRELGGGAPAAGAP